MPSDYEQIREDNIRKYGTDTDHLELLSSHYTNRTHFVFELLQNAEDAKASRILFTLFEDRLEVTHDGRIFNEQDVIGICGVGKGTKADDLTQIGKFGIGFKSVYVYTSAPEIYSGDEHFRMEHYVRPYEVGPKEIEEPWTTRFVLPFDREDFNSEIAFQEIRERLCNLNSMTILFLRNLKEIEFRLPHSYGVCRRNDIKTVGDMRQVEIGTQKDSWLIFERPILVPDSNHQVRVEIAFKLETDLVGDLEGINQIRESPLFVYFPTERDTRLGFLIQGPYRTNLTRDNIPNDDTWNKQLIVETATLIVESMHRLKEMDLLTVSLLEALPIRVEDFAQGGLFHPIFSRVREAFINEELLPANDGTFVSAPSAKLARGDAVRNLLSDEELGDLFEASNEVRWLSGEITENRTHDLWHYFRKELKIEEVDPEMLARRVSEQFLVQQCDEWFIDFYKFLTGQRSLWNSPRSTLRSKPILRLQDGTHVNPSPEGARPNAYLPIGMGNDMVLPIVKERLIQDEEVREFLRNGLKVPEWDIVEEVIKYILPKYKHEFPMVPLEDHKTHFAKIERAYKTDSYEKKSRLRDKLRGTRFIRAEKAIAGMPRYLKPEQLYFGSDELRLYFDGNDSRNFINDDYPSSARELLEDLGIKLDVRINKKEPDSEGHVVFAKYPPWHKRGLQGFDPTLDVDGLKHAIDNPNPEKSAFIWNRIARRYTVCIKGVIEKASWKNFGNSSQKQMTSSFGELLINAAWLPDSAGQMHRPCEIALDNLPESFVRDANLAEKLGLKKDEVAEFAERNGLPVEILSDLIQNPLEYEEFKAWKAEKTVSPPGGGSTGQNTTGKKSKPAFPIKPVRNRERWEKKFIEELENLPEKEYELRLRHVRVTAATEYTRVWLKAMYTNEDEKMICQICEAEMPFKKRDGEYYFEAVEALTIEHFTKEHEAQFLALCPECSAKYKEFVKRDTTAMQEMIDQLRCSNEHQVSLKLGKHSVSLRFVEEHWIGIRKILGSA